MSSLSFKIGNIEFKSPIMIGAGPITGRIDLLRKASQYGAGAVSIKQTPFSEPRPGVRKMYAKKGSFFFNPSDTRLNYNFTADMVKQIKDETDMPVFVNILGQGSNVESWIFLADLMEKAGADAVELNFACPNCPVKESETDGEIEYGCSVSQNPMAVFKIISGITENTKIPVFAKMSGDGTDPAMLARKAKDANATGIVLSFSPRGAFPVDIYNGGRPRMAALDACSFGGINGPAIKQSAQRVVAEAAMAVPDIPIIGGGGITKPEDVIEYLMYGADMAMIFTQIMLEGFEIIPKFNDAILKFIEEQGYDSVSELKGLALKYVIPGSDLDYRVGPPAKVNQEKCVGCRTCEKIAFCRAIQMNDGKAKVDESLCECCGLCASLCPKGAIYF